VLFIRLIPEEWEITTTVSCSTLIAKLRGYKAPLKHSYLNTQITSGWLTSISPTSLQRPSNDHVTIVSVVVVTFMPNYGITSARLDS